MKRCLQCQNKYEAGGPCPQCGSIAFMKEDAVQALTSLALESGPDRPGSKGNAPGAKESMIFGAVGFFGLGLFCGPIAIIQARKARAIIASDPRYGGAELARNGLILGWIDVGMWGIY